jgi:Holliday junction resolvase RusA-like endonuclease
MDAITFYIPGDAIPQPRARATRTGRMYTPTKNGIAVFKDAVGLASTLTARRAGWTVDDAWYEFRAECVFSRPPSHLAASGAVKADAPPFPGLRAGDWDNLAKGVQDAITKAASVWRDDSRVVDGGCRKRYAAPGEAARTIVQIRRVHP